MNLREVPKTRVGERRKEGMPCVHPTEQRVIAIRGLCDGQVVEAEEVCSGPGGRCVGENVQNVAAGLCEAAQRSR